MAINHETLVNQMLIELSKRDALVWKNATGVARALKNDQIIRYGLNGSPDIIGMTPSGIFLGVECKVGRDTQRPEQINFERAVIKRGGIYVLARSLEDVLKWI
jgi:hypothetical protein